MDCIPTEEEVLDTEKTASLTKKIYMTEQGERFAKQELNAMMAIGGYLSMRICMAFFMFDHHRHREVGNVNRFRQGNWQKQSKF